MSQIGIVNLHIIRGNSNNFIGLGWWWRACWILWLWS